MDNRNIIYDSEEDNELEIGILPVNNLRHMPINPQQIIANENENVIFDSDEDEANNGANNLGGANFNQNDFQRIIADPDFNLIIDSEEEAEPIHEVIVDSDEGSDRVITDSEEEDDVEVNGVPINRETFTLDINRNGLNELLRTVRDGNIPAWEHLLLIVAKTLRYKECYKSMLDSFKITNLGFINAILPENMRNFWKVVNRREENFTYVVVCTVCWVVVGEGKKPTRDCTCLRCGPQRKNSELGTYLYLNVRSEMERLLAKPGMAQDLRYPYTRRKRNEGAIEDVYDGSAYQRRQATFLHPANNNYSLAMWVDGVSPVKTANVHIVPVFVQVLELSPRARQRNSTLVAVYVGPRKPLMSSFLLPVTIALNDLYTNGVVWWPSQNEQRTSRFILLILSADSEERYKILEMTRHNGHFGCTFCYANGVPNEEGNGKLTYPVENDRFVADRTDQDIRRDAENANADEHGNPQFGVKGLSALYALRGADLRIIQLLENLHCFWEGNFKRLGDNTMNPQRPDHLTEAQRAVISERITSIRTPTKISRLPRDLAHFAKYTGTEYRNTSWYYWLPCAHDFLAPDHLRLFAIFAEFTFLLSQDSILPADLARADQLIIEYRQLFQDTFPQEEWVYNVHLLKHAVRSVRELGPTWVASGMWFESLNRQVVNYLTSPTDRASQVACRILLYRMVEKCSMDDMPLTPRTLGLLRELIGKEKWDERPDVAVGAYVLEDVGTGGFFSAEQLDALAVVGVRNPALRALRITKHKKIKIDGVMYQVSNNDNTKYNNSIAHVNALYEREMVEFINIHSIVTWEINGVEQRGMFGTRFRTVGPAFGTSYMRIVERFDDLIYVPLANVLTPGVLVQTNCVTYISRLPNRWDND